MRPCEPLCEVTATDPDGNEVRGTLMQYFHFVEGGQWAEDGWVKSNSLRLRIPGYPEDAEQSRHDANAFEMRLVGDFKLTEADAI
jgi:hypothetical protein